MMQKTRVAFFADNLIENYDGAIRTMYQIIDRIPTGRFNYQFYTGEKPKHKFAHQLVQVPSIRLPINHNYKMAASFLATRSLEKSLDSFVPDVIHIATPSPLGHFALRYAQRNDIPVLSIYHTHFLSYVDYYLSQLSPLIPAARNYLISVMQSFYNLCDMVYVPTLCMKEELTQIGVFSNALTLWKRGLPTDTFSPDHRDEGYMRCLTSNVLPNVLFASRLVWEKNLATLIEIYKASEQDGLKYNFIIAGDGYALSSLKKEMPKAIFLGHCNHHILSKLYASSDVFLFPSISETYGNVVMEAKASGLPCVIAGGGGSQELVSDMESGCLCEPYATEEYLSRIDLVLTDRALRQKIIANGLKETQDLSWERLSERYFNDIHHLATYRPAMSA